MSHINLQDAAASGLIFDIPYAEFLSIVLRCTFICTIRTLHIYYIIKRNRIIILNDNMPERMQQIVCAHELGHDALHRQFAKDGGLREFMLYDMKSRPEYEANMYAADLLLDDEEVMELAKDGYDMQQVAGILNTDINLIGLKMASMNYRGFDLRIGIEPKSDFLRS